MFDRLEDLIRRYEELMLELNDPMVANDQQRFRKLMKEQSDLAPIVEAYKEYCTGARAGGYAEKQRRKIKESCGITKQEVSTLVTKGVRRGE